LGLNHCDYSHIEVCNDPAQPVVQEAGVQEAGVQGCKRTPKSFDLGKIRAKSLKIRAKSVET